MIEPKFVERIAHEAHARPEQVAAAIALFDKGATVPFVARYRKDATHNLDEVKLETIHDRNMYFIALTNRRNAVIDNIEKQGALTDDLRAQIDACFDQTTLEDIYLPFKKQRRTKATVAKDQGLEPLANFIWAQEAGDKPLDEYATTFVTPTKSILSVEEAFEGARNILAEKISVDPWARSGLRKRMQEEGVFTSVATKTAADEKTKFEQYYNYSQPLRDVPPHRLLAALRGSRLGILKLDIVLDDEAAMAALAAHYVKDTGSAFAPHLQQAAIDAYKRLLRPSIENEVITLAREHADNEAIKVFRDNARNLLLAAPAGHMPVIGVDPGLRSGCKLAAIDENGNYLESVTVYPLEPHNEVDKAAVALLELMDKYKINAIAVGNGTGSRDVAKFVDDVLRKSERKGAFSVLVSEAGASVYSASPVAREEFPDLDVTVRGAISIARRLQDPLSELVKLDPKTLGVGQYQHDVSQRELRESLCRTVESAVNWVGVDLNSASAELLRYVSGIQMGTAQNIVAFRKEHGSFISREQLKEVNGIGEKTYEQCAGFLRIPNALNPLDRTAIHPEAYGIVTQLAADQAVPVEAIVGNPDKVNHIDLATYANETVGRYTLDDIKEELRKPGRDPRREFRVPKFIEGVGSIEALVEGMESEGVVTNVTDFGAFIDIGVHQDGLVHLSEISHRFIKDPRELLKVGDIVRVKVIKVDRDHKRVSLSMKQLIAPPARPQGDRHAGRPERAPRPEGAPRRDDRGPRPPRPEGAPQEGQAVQAPMGDRPARPPRRDDRAPRRDGEQRREGAPRPQRPDRGNDRNKERAPREGGDSRPPRQNRDRGDRRPNVQANRLGTPSALKHASGSQDSGFNSILADKLAALKDQLK